MIDRIREFIENQGISIRAFEQKISASNGLIRKAIANNTDIQSKWLTNIIDNYPQINPEWLLTGKGLMLRTTTSEPLQATTQPNDDIITLLKEQLEKKDKKIEEQAQEIGMLKSDNRKLMEVQVMGLDISERKSSTSTSPSPSQSEDAPSAAAHL